MSEKTFNVETGMMTHFDCRDIEDLIKSRRYWNDWSPTFRVWDNQKNEYVDMAPEIEWNKYEQKELRTGR